MPGISELINRYRRRFLKKGVVYIVDLLCSIGASIFVLMLVSLLVREHDFHQRQVLMWLCMAAFSSMLSFAIGKVYRTIIRYSTLREIGRLSLMVAGKEVMLFCSMALFTSFTFTSELLMCMVLIDFFTTLGALMLLRVILFVMYDGMKSNSSGECNMHRVLVYGLTEKSVAAVSRLMHSPHYKIVGFITYGRDFVGHQLSGLKVYYFETKEDVQHIARSQDIDGILFAYVADARSEQDRLMNHCREAKLKTYIIPGVDEITDGKLINKLIRNVNIEDLLGRPEIKVSMDVIGASLKDKVVMVTGAAGSIGSELCRQLATFNVKQLVLFDNGESPLHNIRLELEDTYPGLNFVPVIGDVRSRQRLDYVFRKYSPQIVFHAAAYKHVPLMEENPCEAVHVNVVGSRLVADKCVEYGAEKMVMVSTDKAVNPTNIMGCTKRLAEVYVQSLGLAIERGEVSGTTRFVTTRFGNVLGSNGSVIPRFREQLEQGGPITVTHPEINRFFMSIPEACRLVMEAATFATGTQIFVFDMGESVKIVTLAERMIHLAGLEVGRDIKIEFTGLRPGEKLYEEVLATKENTLPTTHERIFVAKAREYPYDMAAGTVDKLLDLATRGEVPDMVRLMKRTVPEFKSKNSTYERYDHEIEQEIVQVEIAAQRMCP